jgi:hypothetical protein
MKKIRIILFLFLTAAVYANDNQRSLTFAEAAELAVISSIELRQARASQDLNEGIWKLGIREYFPRLGLNVSENDRLQEIGADSFIKNYGVSLDQLIWDGGRISMTRNLERMELDLSSSRLGRMASEVAESAIAAYRNILSSRAILEIRKTALLVLEEQRRILNEEVALGLALAVDIANADINLAEAKIDIYSLQLDLAEMESQFAELLGLDLMPVLAETVDVNRSVLLPAVSAAGALAREKNPDLIDARFSLTKRQAELKYVSRSWIPTLRLTGNFGLSGQRYPLTRYNWSIGISIDFSNPWFQSRFSTQAGWEPPHDMTAAVQNGLNPLPDPASGFGKKQASLALEFEQDRYNIILERTGRIAANAVEKCSLVEQKRVLALDAARLAAERCRIEEIRLELGQITRLKLMETLIEQTQREIAVIEAVVAMLEAERELERFLDLKPGELAVFAALMGDI